MKPLFPALVALLHLAGASWTGAGRALSAVAGGATVALCGLVTARLTGSRLLGVFAALLVLLDPVDRYWAAFSSPDLLGQSLALGAVLAVLARRPAVGGLLAGLAAFARPELGLLLLAGSAVLVLRPACRGHAVRFLATALATAAAVLILLRPPLQLRPGELSLAICVALGAAALALLAPPRWGVAAGLAALAVAALNGTALAALARHEPAVAASFVVALVLARNRRPAAVVALAMSVLALAFEARNGASTRYLTELLPLVAIGIALGLREALSPVRRGAAVVVAAVVVASVGLATPAPAPGPDMFGGIARALPATGQPVVTSAADAYGFLLYPRAVRSLATGSHGLLLVDATTRAYEPWIAVRGQVVSRISPGDGFVDPNGRLDLAPALLIEGTAHTRSGA